MSVRNPAVNFVVFKVCKKPVGALNIGVGRGGGGGGRGGGGLGPPPNNFGGGPTYPLAPPNNPPAFSFNFYVKQEKITNVPS